MAVFTPCETPQTQVFFFFFDFPLLEDNAAEEEPKRVEGQHRVGEGREQEQLVGGLMRGWYRQDLGVFLYMSHIQRIGPT